MTQKSLPGNMHFTNEVVNKKKLQQLMYFTFHNYGVIKSSIIADKVKNLTFHYATLSGISLSIEDLRVPFTKRTLVGMTTDEVALTEQNYNTGNITTVERFQKVIDIWNNANNVLKSEVLTYFRESDPLNPLYIMAFSGARGNISQVRQLVGMRGLMADPQGQIIDLPIQSNFREGLKVTEYIISSYGARKGLVDTALRTADSGYLTRRLVDVAQDIIVREDNCLTEEGLSLNDLFAKYKTDYSYKDRLVGRLLLKPVKIEKHDIYWPENMEITNDIVQKILDFKIDDIIVRSPLTCNAARSICRKCYGWHLSYSKLIDLGEAVGILAAQSIGEPGTQLTMRTFHTGGVFSGDLTKQIRAPFAGTVNYTLTSPVNIVRTIHGEKGFNLLEGVKLSIETKGKTLCSLNLPIDTLLLVKNEQKVYPNQVLAEIKKDANLVLEEDRKEIYTEVSGETFLQNIKVKKLVDGDGAAKKISLTNGLLWVLYGRRYVLPTTTNLMVANGQRFTSSEIVASQRIANKFPGIVSLNNLKKDGEIKILFSSIILENSLVKTLGNKTKLLNLSTEEGSKNFQLYVENGTILKHGQKIASLLDNTYKTETGGILFYSTDQESIKKKKNKKRTFRGSLYWVPEETHIYKNIGDESIFVQNGSFVRKNTCILPDVYTGINGFVHINETEEEIIIKPGELYQLDTALVSTSEQINRFVKPGEHFFQNDPLQLKAQKLLYLEFLSIQEKTYVLLRPVRKYIVPQEKGFFMSYKFFPNEDRRSIVFQTVKRIFYKNGERVKRNQGGANLLQTYLVLDIKNAYSDLQARVELLPTKNATELKLKLALYECIKTKDANIKINSETNTCLACLVQNNQYVTKNTTIAKSDLFLKSGGTLIRANKTNTSLEILVLKDEGITKFTYNKTNERLIVKEGDLVRVGSFLTSNVRSKYAGQIYRIKDNVITLRLGRPYLISEGTILRVENNTLVEKSDLLATLVFEKLKTVDIVQGLPKVEEILEARKIKGCVLAPHEGKAFFKDGKIEITKPTGDKLTVGLEAQTKVNFQNGSFVKFLEPLTDGPISPHDKLETLFNYYVLTNTIHVACKKSFKHLQLFLVNEVQRTYFSQGVQIADKHIEIIVKQMTSKVRVFSSGDTTLLPGEILDISQAEMITNAAINGGEEPPLYKPMLLGLTKASLNSDSFISAASFQETTRVLTEAAIEGKRDWLYGLKENVIIGRLIPAGTGFNCFENLKKVGKESSLGLLLQPTKNNKLKSFVLETRVE